MYGDETVNGSQNLNKMSTLLQYFRYFSKVALPIGLLFVTTCFTSIAMLVQPFISKIIYDKLIPTSDETILKLIIVSLVVVYLLFSLSNFLTENLTIQIRGKLITFIRNDITGDLLKYKFIFFKRFEIGTIVQRLIPEVDSISSTLAAIVKALAYLLQLILLFCVILFFNSVFFLICVAVLIVYVLWHSLLKRPIDHVTKKAQSLQGDLYCYFFEHLQNIKLIKLFNLDQRSINHLEFRLRGIKKYTLLNSGLRTLLVIATKFLDVCLLCIMVYSMYRISSGHMSVGYYLLFTMLLTRIVTPINFLLEMGNQFATGKTAVQRITEITNGEMEMSGNREFGFVSNKIEYRNVEFSYEQNQKILDGISFHIGSGSTVAFVGASGSGKSTVIQLLIRLYDPSSGDIFIDGQSIQNFDLISLREKISVLSQDFFLFNDSIIANIDPRGILNTTSIEEILTQADLSDFKKRLNYIVGENGWNLSGGERQRLSIARLIAKRPNVIVFDEATSNLDPKTEGIIMERIQHLKKSNPSLIIIMITHRTQHLVQMDKVFFVNSGRVADSGSHVELSLRNPEYMTVLQTSNN